MLSIKGVVKNNSKTSNGEFGIVTVGPTEETNGFMLTGCKLDDQVDVDVDVELLDDGRVTLAVDDESIDDKDVGDDVWTVVD